MHTPNACPEDRRFTFRVAARSSGHRLDTVVSEHLENCSRSLAATLIRAGAVQVNGTASKPAYRVHAGDRIDARLPPPAAPSYQPEKMPLDILFEDDQLLVLNKQPGVVVHPAPGHATGTLVNGLLYHCPDLEGVGLERRPGIVHRLDKETSGALVVAKNGVSLEALARQFKARRVEKTYLALVYGRPATPRGAIALPIGRHPVARKKMAVNTPRGRKAESLWRLKELFAGVSLLEVDLKTGRTHQIRVHCAAIGHPIVGDRLYGSRRAGAAALRNQGLAPVQLRKLLETDRQMLHAWRLKFSHPRSGLPMAFEAPLAADMLSVLAVLRQT